MIGRNKNRNNGCCWRKDTNFCYQSTIFTNHDAVSKPVFISKRPWPFGRLEHFFFLSLSRSPGADRSSFILLTSINKKENEIVCVCRNASAGFSPDIILVNDRDFLKMGVITGQERNQIGRQRHTHTDQHSSATHKFLSPYGRQWHLKKEKKKKGLRPPHAPSGKAGGVRPETYGYSPLVLSTRPVPTPKWSRQLRWQFSTFFFSFLFFFFTGIFGKKVVTGRRKLLCQTRFYSKLRTFGGYATARQTPAFRVD